MSDAQKRSVSTPPGPSPEGRGWLIGGAIAFVIVSAVTALLLVRGESPQVEAPTVPAEAKGTSALPTPLAPAFEEAGADAQLRAQLLPLFAKDAASWFDGAGATRRWVAAVAQVAEGNSPRALFPMARLPTLYEVERKKGQLVQSARSAARADGLVALATKPDPASVAAAYRSLRPVLEAAHAEIGRPGSSFDASLRRALSHLTAFELPTQEPAVVLAKGATYRFASADLESLSAAQKQLLRLGVHNARRVQAWLAELSEQLGANV